MSDSAVFRQAIEGMTATTTTTTTTTTMESGKTKTKDGKNVSADTDGPERIKKTPCGTDCGQYLELKNKINELSKYVNAVKDQKEQIKETDNKLQALGKQIQDLNNSLSPGGKVNIAI
jgi:archaellum component FlaC